jgi:uroporphyrin-III C-methyltransferase / precorrin-2 dehydrogenase / sirohydrochlorin ferrochelatase
MFLPLLFKDGFSCLIVGGGQVAARKVTVLRELPCIITMIAPQIADQIHQEVRTGSVRWIEREYSLGDCNGFQLVIAATPVREVNRTVSDEAKKLCIPVNVVDDPSLSTVIFPAVWRDKSLVIAVSTEGVAPFMASKIRTRLAAHAHELGDWVEIAGRFRSIVRKEIKDPGEKEKFYELFPDQRPPGKCDDPPENGRLNDWLSWLDKINRSN